MNTAVAGTSRRKVAKNYLPHPTSVGAQVSPNYVFLVCEKLPSKRWATLCVVAKDFEHAEHIACLAAGEEGYSEVAMLSFLGFEA